MAQLSPGDPAPDFTLEGTDGRFTLSEHRGERVVLLFYPGDDGRVAHQHTNTLGLAYDSVDDIAAALRGLPAPA